MDPVVHDADRKVRKAGTRLKYTSSDLPDSLSKLHKAHSAGEVMTQFSSSFHESCYRLLQNPTFEHVFGLIIMFNFVVVIIETDAAAKAEMAAHWVEATSWTILACFIVELVLRLFVHGLDFWYDGINIFDFVLIAVDVLMNFLGIFATQAFPVSFLRIIRLCRLARVSKALHHFPELRLMMAGIMGSLRTIFWGTVTLTFALLVSAILAVQFIHPLNEYLAEQGKYVDCDRCHRAYASVFEATLSLGQALVAGDGWGELIIVLIEHYPATGVFFVVAYMIIGMGVLNLILGVVVDVASQARARLSTEIHNKQTVQKLEAHSHLLQICQALDTDCNGKISKEELFEGYEMNEEFQQVLSRMEVTGEDLEVLWAVLGDEKSGVSYSVFASSCYKLKSSTTDFMLAYIRYYVTDIKKKICEDLDRIMSEEKRIEELERQVIADKVMKIEKSMSDGGLDPEMRYEYRVGAKESGITTCASPFTIEVQCATVQRANSCLSMERILEDTIASMSCLASELKRDAKSLKDDIQNGSSSKPVVATIQTQTDVDDRIPKIAKSVKEGLCRDKAMVQSQMQTCADTPNCRVVL